MKITERLNVEHGVFLGLLEQLEDLRRQAVPHDVLLAVARVIVRAFDIHCEMEDRVLYPALVEAFGTGFAPLEAMEADHGEIDRMARAVESGDCDDALIGAFAAAARAHIEKEIHGVFPLAEEWLAPETLASMCDWYADHVRERAGRAAG